MLYNLHIKNYKGYGKKRIHLIDGAVYSGGNNSGKTTMLEAAYLAVLDKERLLRGLVNTIGENTIVKQLRYPEDYIRYIEEKKDHLFNDTSKPIHIQFDSNDIKLRIHKGSLEIKMGNMKRFKGLDYFISSYIDIEKVYLNKDDVYDMRATSAFINDGDMTESIGAYYQGVQHLCKEHVLNGYLKELFFIDGAFKIIGDQPMIGTKLKNVAYTDRALHTYGKSISKFILIVSAIYSSKNACVFIDDIYNYFGKNVREKLIDEIIPKISKEMNVITFSTASVY